MNQTVAVDARARTRARGVPGPHGRRRPAWPTVLAFMYAAAAGLAQLAWWTVGDTAVTQLVNLTTFWWSLPAVLLAPAALLARRPAAAALLGVPAVLWLWAYGGAFLPNAAAPDRADLRVATFNTYVDAPSAAHVLDLASSHEPDVLLLQEVTRDRAEQLSAALADSHPHQHVVASQGVSGIALVSRFAIVDIEPIVDPSVHIRDTAVVTLDVDGRPVQVVALHLTSFCPACGDGVVERIEHEGDVRRAEVQRVLDELDPDVPAIVGGDLNSNERSDPYRTLVAGGFADAQRVAGSGMGFTFPSIDGLGPLLRIDWLLTRGLTAADAFVPDGGASDHRPVVADIVLGSSP